MQDVHAHQSSKIIFLLSNMEKEILRHIINAFSDKINVENGEIMTSHYLGDCIFLYTYSRMYKDKSIEEVADTLVDKYWNMISSEFISDQEKAEILFGFDWLRINGFVNYDITDSIINNIDSCIIKERYSSPLLLDSNMDIFFPGLFLYYRYKAYRTFNQEKATDNTILYEFYLRENLIFFIDECES